MSGTHLLSSVFCIFSIVLYTVLTDPDMILPLFVCFVVLVNTVLLKYAYDTIENLGLITMLIRTEIMHIRQKFRLECYKIYASSAEYF